MKSRLLFLVFIFPLAALAQKKHYLAVAFSKDFPLHYHVIGGHFTANWEVAKNIYLGAGTGIHHLDNIENLYYPLYANLSWIAKPTKKKIAPVFFLQPGYGFYHHRENNLTTKGGFIFSANGGISYPFLWKTRGYLSFAVGHYGFSGGETGKTALGGRIGMMF